MLMRAAIVVFIVALILSQADGKIFQRSAKEIKARGAGNDNSEEEPEISKKVGWFKIENGLFGDWKHEVVFPKNFYACGAQIKYDDTGGDQTTVNGLRFMVCKRSKEEKSWRTQVNLLVYEGKWGDWKPMTMCPEDGFINGIQIKFEEYKGVFRDDTALNGIRLKCNMKYSPEQNYTAVWKKVFEGFQGTWKVPTIFPDFNVCGARVRYEDSKGLLIDSFYDNTALNGLELLFCKARLLKTVKFDYKWDQANFTIQSRRTEHTLHLNNTLSAGLNQNRKSMQVESDIKYEWKFDQDYFYDMNTRAPVVLELARLTNKINRSFHTLKKKQDIGLIPNHLIEEKVMIEANFRVFAAPGQCMNSILIADIVSLTVPFTARVLTEDDLTRKVAGTFYTEYVHENPSFLNEEC